MNGFRRSALAAALVLGAAACGSPTGPEDDLSRFLPVIDESTIALPDSVQLAVPFNVDSMLGCPSDWDVVFDLEYYAGARVVILPSCVGVPSTAPRPQTPSTPSRAVEVELDFGEYVGGMHAWATAYVVGENGTFERYAPVVQ